jgi:hypothetical protein
VEQVSREWSVLSVDLPVGRSVCRSLGLSVGRMTVRQGQSPFDGISIFRSKTPESPSSPPVAVNFFSSSASLPLQVSPVRAPQRLECSSLPVLSASCWWSKYQSSRQCGLKSVIVTRKDSRSKSQRFIYLFTVFYYFRVFWSGAKYVTSFSPISAVKF